MSVSGALIGYGAAWSWNGFLHFVAVSRGAAAPATSTVQTGLSFGAGAGPHALVLGVVANFGGSVGWLMMAVLMLVAAAIIGLWARRSEES